jgi:hypothetical protein
MGTSSLVALAGMGLVAMLVAFVVGILVAGLALCVAFRLIIGYMPAYLRSLGVVLLTAVAVMVASIVLGMLMHGGANGWLGVAVEFLVGAAVVNCLLLSQNGSRIGYGKACLVQLVYMVIGFVLFVIAAAILAAIFGTAILGTH